MHGRYIIKLISTLASQQFHHIPPSTHPPLPLQFAALDAFTIPSSALDRVTVSWMQLDGTKATRPSLDVLKCDMDSVNDLRAASTDKGEMIFNLIIAPSVIAGAK